MGNYQVSSVGWKTDFRAAAYNGSSKTIYMAKGEADDLQFVLWDYNQDQPVDLTDAALTFTLSDGYDAPASRLSKTVGDGITVTDAEQGLFEVEILAADTSDLPVKTYLYELRFTDQSGKPDVIIMPPSEFVIRGALS